MSASGLSATTCSISTPPSRREHEQGLPDAAVESDGEVVLALDVRGRLDPEAAHDVTPDVEPEDLGRASLGLVGPLGELDAAGLSTPAGQHLRLHDDRPAELLRGGARLGRRRRHAPRGDRDPEARQQLLPLVLVQVHVGEI